MQKEKNYVYTQKREVYNNLTTQPLPVAIGRDRGNEFCLLNRGSGGTGASGVWVI